MTLSSDKPSFLRACFSRKTAHTFAKHAVVSKMLRSATAFRTNKNGAVAIIYAIAIIPIMAGVGAAVDMSNMSKHKSNLQNALDAAVLSGATTAQGLDPLLYSDDVTKKSKIEPIVVAHLKSQLILPPSGALTKTDVNVYSTSGRVAATAEVKIPTYIMKMFNRSAGLVHAESQVNYGAGIAEIALAIDTTGSMTGAKLDAAKAAATAMVNTLMTPANKNRVKMSLVPFDRYVNVGTTYAGASWLTNTASYPETVTYGPSCYDTYPNAVYGPPQVINTTCYNDGTPYSCSYTNYPVISYGAPVNVCNPAGSYVITHNWYGCVGSRNYPSDLTEVADSGNKVPAIFDVACAKPLQRLTTNENNMINQIAALTASDETYITPGLLWAWRTLAPTSPFNDAASYSTTDQTRKIIILMTDGAQTRSPNYPDHENSDTNNANALLSQTCAAVKSKAIQVMTIAFTVTDPTIKNILKNCATSPADFYDAADIAAMSAAWSTIGRRISSLRISK